MLEQSAKQTRALLEDAQKLINSKDFATHDDLKALRADADRAMTSLQALLAETKASAQAALENAAAQAEAKHAAALAAQQVRAGGSTSRTCGRTTLADGCVALSLRVRGAASAGQSKFEEVPGSGAVCADSPLSPVRNAIALSAPLSGGGVAHSASNGWRPSSPPSSSSSAPRWPRPTRCARPLKATMLPGVRRTLTAAKGAGGLGALDRSKRSRRRRHRPRPSLRARRSARRSGRRSRRCAPSRPPR